MDTSIFYREIFARRELRVPMLAFERISLLLDEINRSELDAEAKEQAIYGAYVTTISDCCGIKEPDESHIAALSDRVQKVYEKLPESPPPSEAEAQDTSVSFGTSFMKMIDEATALELLMEMTHYDAERARYWYCVADRDDALECIKGYIRHATEGHKIMFESVLFGMGGSYGEETHEVEEQDVPEVSAKELFAMMH